MTDAEKTSRKRVSTTPGPRTLRAGNDNGQTRFDTDPRVSHIVVMRAAGHCELCGTDLTQDYRIGRSTWWGEVGHILPASPRGPGATFGYSADDARRLTNDPRNLMLVCPGCHKKIDKDADGYPREDLSHLHLDQLERIRLAASLPAHERAVPLIVLSQHFATLNQIRDHDLLQAMLREGLTATCDPIQLVLPKPGSTGRDQQYWRSVSDQIHHQLDTKLNRANPKSANLLAVAALADIPSLVMLGQFLGDRMPRRLFSPNRATGLHWPDPDAMAPTFLSTTAPTGEGPVALVLSLSARIPEADILRVLTDARIAELRISEPSISMMKSRSTIDAFRTELQKFLSELEYRENGSIHVFMAVPAVLGIEFGALLTLQHRHSYVIYDRSDSGHFEPVVTLDHSQKALGI